VGYYRSPLVGYATGVGGGFEDVSKPDGHPALVAAKVTRLKPKSENEKQKAESGQSLLTSAATIFKRRAAGGHRPPLQDFASGRSLGFFISVFYNDASPDGLENPCASVVKNSFA